MYDDAASSPSNNRAPAAVSTFRWPVVLSFYAILSYLMLCGLEDPRKLLDHYIGGGEAVLWSNYFWWFGHAIFELHQNPFLLSHLFHPLPVGIHDCSVVLLLFSPLTRIIGSIGSYNIVVLLSFAAAGFSTFLLVRHLGMERPASFVAGLIYTFSAHHLAHTEHLHVSSNYWIPLIVLLYYRFRDHPSHGRAQALGISFGLAALTSWTLALMIGVFLVVVALGAGRTLWRKDILLPLGLAAGTSLVVMAPGLYWILQLRGLPGAMFGVKESIFWSADLVAFLTPPPPHRFFGTAFSPLFERFASGYPESVVYLGFVASALAVIGLRIQRPMPSRLKLFAAATAVFAALALGPVLQVAGYARFSDAHITIALPGAIAPYIPILDMQRTPNRYAVMIVLFIAVFAARALTWVPLRLGAGRWGATLIAAGSGILVLGDSLHHVPVLVPARPVAGIYKRLTADKSNRAVIEVPVIRSGIEWTIPHDDPMCHYYEAQKHHQHPLFGGYFNRVNDVHGQLMKEDPVLNALYHGKAAIPQEQTDVTPLVHLASRYNVGYVFLHKNWLSREDLNALTEFLGDEYMEDESVLANPIRVYAIDPVPQVAVEHLPQLLFQEGWYAAEPFPGGTTHWMTEEARLVLYSQREGILTLHFDIQTFARPRTLVVQAGGQSHRFTAPPDEWIPVSIRVPISTGPNNILLSVPEGGQRPNEIDPSVPDARLLAINLRRFRREWTD